MKEKIEGFLQEKEHLTKELQAYVVNKDIPLEERWDLFIGSDLGVHKSFYQDFIHAKARDVSGERYSNTDVDEILEFMEDDNYSEKQINEFKEDALKKFIKSYNYDW